MKGFVPPEDHPLWATFWGMMQEMVGGDVESYRGRDREITDKWEWFLLGARTGVDRTIHSVKATMREEMRGW